MPGQIVFAVMDRSGTTEPNMLLLLLLVWQDLPMIHVMVICRNIILPVKPLKKMEIMPKILPWKCLPLLWACLMILYLTGIREKNNGETPGKIYKTQNITQSAEGHKDGLWTTAISPVILML